MSAAVVVLVVPWKVQARCGFVCRGCVFKFKYLNIKTRL